MLTPLVPSKILENLLNVKWKIFHSVPLVLVVCQCTISQAEHFPLFLVLKSLQYLVVTVERLVREITLIF
jgi:hypothetical protein